MKDTLQSMKIISANTFRNFILGKMKIIYVCSSQKIKIFTQFTRDYFLIPLNGIIIKHFVLNLLFRFTITENLQSKIKFKLKRVLLKNIHLINLNFCLAYVRLLRLIVFLSKNNT